jgi:hypothetical protein
MNKFDTASETRCGGGESTISGFSRGLLFLEYELAQAAVESSAGL